MERQQGSIHYFQHTLNYSYQKLFNSIKKQKQNEEVDCPFIIYEYNRHMKGVDFLDSLIARCKIKFRSRKWYMRLLYHLIDLTTVNSWLLYRHVQEKKYEKHIIELANRRKIIANSLLKSGTVKVTRDRKSSLELQVQKTRPQ